MTRETDRPAGSPPTVDDDQLAALVRTTVDDWRLPPQRLDQPTWRDRVGGGGTGRRRGWFARLAGPAGAAVLATVIVAFVAVWLTAPRSSSPIGKASPTASGTDSPSQPSSLRPTASGLPVLQLNGALPDPAHVLVNTGASYRIVDLSTGTLGDVSIRSHSGPTAIFARSTGGWSCICADWTGSSPTGIDLTFESVAADGRPLQHAPLRTLRGAGDPSLPTGDQPELVDVHASASADGRHAFVGWSERHGAAGWTGGVDVVDLSSGTVVGSTTLAMAAPTGAGGRPTIRIAPQVTPGPSGGTVLISSFWFVNDPSERPPSGTDHWMASFDGSVIGHLAEAGSTADQSCGEIQSGPIDATMYYVICITPTGPIAIDRRAADGKAIDSTAVPGTSSGLEPGWLSLRLGDRLYIWDPIMARLARFDLRTAAIDDATGTAAVPSSMPWDSIADVGRQIGRWMAPPVAAKVFLQPALVASTDGTRIYGLGVERPSGEGSGGSRGVYAFDAASLEPLGHWAPTADLASLAISPDGRFVYAAGQPGVDAAGNRAPYWASVTVYDTTDGSVRLIAGKLGTDGLFFATSTAP